VLANYTNKCFAKSLRQDAPWGQMGHMFYTLDLGYQILYLNSKNKDNLLKFQRINGTMKRTSKKKSARTTRN
jgi:hypothetical protein